MALKRDLSMVSKAEDYPFCSKIERQVVIYDGDKLRADIKTPELLKQL